MAWMSRRVLLRSYQLLLTFTVLFLISACSNPDNSSNSEPTQNKSAVQGETVVLSAGDIANDSGIADDSIGVELTLEWRIVSRPPGSNAELSDPEVSETTFIADQPGEYVIGLIIRNGTEELLNTTFKVIVEPADSSEPAPTDPEPTDPTPTDPTPTDPNPTDPTPTDPTPNPEKPTTHLPTTDNCVACHNQDTWVVTGFDHAEAIGACVDCHNNVSVLGKPLNHVNSTDNCGACHRIDVWVPLSAIDHGETLGSCSGCHVTPIWSPYPPTHIPTTEDCGVCHTTDAWIPASGPDHATFVGNCISCHDGVRATGKVSNHIASTDLCDACHDKLATDWMTLLSTGVDHSHVIGNCSDCHNGELARGMGAIHIETLLECDNCHITSAWSLISTPDHSGYTENCTTCHDGQIASGKSANHIFTTDVCEACHVVFPATWAPVANTSVDHTHVVGTCVSCHTGFINPMPPPDHIPSTDNCGACHEPGPTPWAPVDNSAVDHTQVLGVCSSCHDNIIATGKNVAHVPTAEECSICHSVSQWIPAAVDHTNFTGGCISCHDGILASGKSDAHINSTDECNACHEVFPAQWKPVANNAVEHSQVIGLCLSCHDNVIATGKSETHIATSEDCSICHSTRRWVPAAIDHTGFVNNCVTCHDGIVASGKGDTHIDSTDVCDACHLVFPAQWTPVAGSLVDHTQVIGTCSSCHALPAGHIEITEECDQCHNLPLWLPVQEPGSHDLWVIDNNNDFISKLNLVNGSTEFQFVAPGGYSDSDSNHGLTWDGEFFWSFHMNSGRLYKVDVNGAIVDFFEFPGGLIGLEYVNGNLWAVRGETIYVINPANGSYTTFPSPVAAASAIGFDGAGHVWVVGNTGVDEIYTIDIVTNEVQYRFNSPDRCPSGMDIYNNQLYILGCDGLWVLDTATGDTIQHILTNGIGYGTGITFVPANIGANSNTPPVPPNVQPVAVIDADTSVIVGTEVSLNGGNSYDENNDALTYQWDFSYQPVGSSALIMNDTAVTASFIPDVSGTYHIRLIVNDGKVDSYPMILAVYAVVAGTCYSNAECGANSFCKTPDGACGGAGICTDTGEGGICPEIYAPVCGCNGVTYGNSCQATVNSVSIASYGVCP